jgi:hypothetical protein
MSEMIERVARAMVSHLRPDQKDCSLEQLRHVDVDESDLNLVELARAAIEAMREPTEAMMESAASEFTFQSGHWGSETTPETIQKAVFQRAIDAALSEKP